LVSACISFEVNGVRDRGRCKKTWDECMKKDSVEMGLHREWALDRVVSYAETIRPVHSWTRKLNGDNDDKVNPSHRMLQYIVTFTCLDLDFT